VGARLYCPHALADRNQRIWIREKKLEFYSTVLSPYLGSGTKGVPKSVNEHVIKWIKNTHSKLLFKHK